MLVDSTVVIDLLRGVPAAGAWATRQTQVMTASEVTRAEVLRGMRSSERATTRHLLGECRWWPVEEAISTRAGELGRRFRRSHDLATADLLIAATAQVHGLPLMTSNTRHFPMFEGLQPPY